MYRGIGFCGSRSVIIFMMTIFYFSQPAFSQSSYQLEVKVGDVIACPGQQNVAIPIYMKNYSDTIAGFNLWLHLNRSDIMEFQNSIDFIQYDVHYIYTSWEGDPPIPTDSVIASPCWVCTAWDGVNCVDSTQQLGYYNCLTYDGNDNCTDSAFVQWTEGIDPVYTESIETYVANIDRAGTLTENWETIWARSLLDNGQDILITAYSAHLPDPPEPNPTYPGGIGYPQEGEIPLIKLLANVYPVDESLIGQPVTIKIEYDILDYFGFSNELGESPCIISEQIEQNSYYMCEQWLVPDEVCLWWNRVQEYECPPEGCDSVHVDTLQYGYLDVPRCCDPLSGECDLNAEEADCPDMFGGTGVWHDGCIKITDGSLIVKQCICGDINDDLSINILDIVSLISYLYKGSTPPVPLITGDINGDGKVDILDIVCLLNSIYKSGFCYKCGWYY